MPLSDKEVVLDYLSGITGYSSHTPVDLPKVSITAKSTDSGLDDLFAVLDGGGALNEVISVSPSAFQRAVRELELEGFVVVGKKGKIKLTRSGVVASVRLRPKFEGPNVTSVILRHILETKYDNVIHSLGRLCKISSQNGSVPSELSDFIVTIIARDGLRDRCIVGKPAPSASQLARWAYHQAISKWRENAHDAVGRATTGALMKGEVVASTSALEVVSDAILIMSDEDGGARKALLDTVGGDLRDDVEYLMVLGDQNIQQIVEKNGAVSHNTYERYRNLNDQALKILMGTPQGKRVPPRIMGDPEIVDVMALRTWVRKVDGEVYVTDKGRRALENWDHEDKLYAVRGVELEGIYS